jgi:hypothetical protein
MIRASAQARDDSRYARPRGQIMGLRRPMTYLTSRNSVLLLEQVPLDCPVSRPDYRPDDPLDEAEAAAKGSGTFTKTNIYLIKKGDEAKNTIQGKHQFHSRFHFNPPSIDDPSYC